MKKIPASVSDELNSTEMVFLTHKFAVFADLI